MIDPADLYDDDPGLAPWFGIIGADPMIALEAVEASYNAAMQAAGRVRALHAVDEMHQLCDDENCPRAHALDDDGARVHPDVITSRTCRHCSVAELVDAPCPTIRTLDGLEP